MADIARAKDARANEEPEEIGSDGIGVVGSGPIATRTGARYRPPVKAVVKVKAVGQSEDTAALAEQSYQAEREGGRIALWVATAVAALLIGVMLLVLLGGSVSVGDVLSAFSVRFLSLFIEAAPFLLLGTLVSGLIDTFVRQDHIVRFVPRNRFLGVVLGTFAGFVFPVCECGVVPVVRQLYSKKLPTAVGVAFLLGAPVMNPIVLFSTWAAFGWGPLLIGRYVISAIVAMSVGLFFAFRGKHLELRAPGAQIDVDEGPGSHLATLPQEVQHMPVITKLRQALVVAGDEFFEMGRFLVIGGLLASAMQTLVSQDVLLALGQGPVISVLVMQALAFLLSVCSTVDAFLALAFAGAFTSGSLLSFLTFGPMVDIKSTIMYLGVFKPKTVAFLVGLPFVLTLLFGVGLNLFGG